MPLLNYTTDVPVSRSVGHVQALLAKGGATRIAIDYDGGEPSGVAFQVDGPQGPLSYVLPIRAHLVHAVLQQERIAQRYQTPEHAKRVAWRIVKDWLEAQLAMLAADLVTMDQLMLPYQQVGPGQTVYDLWREQHLALPSPSG